MGTAIRGPQFRKRGRDSPGERKKKNKIIKTSVMYESKYYITARNTNFSNKQKLSILLASRVKEGKFT